MMIRLLLGAALSALGLALVAAWPAADLVTGLDGAPMIVADADRPTLEPAYFDGESCPSKLLLAPREEKTQGAIRVVAIALGPDGRDLELAISGPETAEETVLLLFDEHGRLVAAREPAMLQPHEAHGGCGALPPAPGGV